MKSLLLPALLFIGGAITHAADPSDLMRQGDLADAQFHTDAALSAYLQASHASPGDADILYHVAREYGLSMDDVSGAESKRALGEKALDFAQQAVAADPKNAKAQLALAISYGRLAPLLDSRTKIAYGRLVKTHADLAVTLDPKDDLTYHVLGCWNYEFANLNPMLRAIASAIYGTLPSASNEEAARDFKKALELNPNRIGNHVELARTYVAMGQADAARRELKQSLSMPVREKDDIHEKQVAEETLRSL